MNEIRKRHIIFTEKGGEAKVRGDEIKGEGLKSITNYERKLLFKKTKHSWVYLKYL